MSRAKPSRGGMFLPPKPAALHPSPVPTQSTAMQRLEELRQQHLRVQGLVNGAQLLDEVIQILAPVLSLPEPLYSVQQAADLLGYRQHYLARLVREGKIPNHGAKGRPRVRLSECAMARGPRNAKSVPAKEAA